MAVFVSASDESAGKTRQDQFVFAGWVASEQDWSEIFTPAWQRLVLDGPPKIPFLHMTDARSPAWRIEHSLSDAEADRRVDEAVAILHAADFLYPVGLKVSGAQMSDSFGPVKLRSHNRKSSEFAPDYLCFLGYAIMALKYVNEKHPDCEKLDFLVERNGKITAYIQDFHSNLSGFFERAERPDLARLVGELLPVGKDRIPVQAADVLCWHTARAQTPWNMDGKDYERYSRLSKKEGWLEILGKDLVQYLADQLRGE
jgi:hypothetical protein